MLPTNKFDHASTGFTFFKCDNSESQINFTYNNLFTCDEKITSMYCHRSMFSYGCNALGCTSWLWTRRPFLPMGLLVMGSEPTHQKLSWHDHYSWSKLTHNTSVQSTRVGFRGIILQFQYNISIIKLNLIIPQIKLVFVSL